MEDEANANIYNTRVFITAVSDAHVFTQNTGSRVYVVCEEVSGGGESVVMHEIKRRCVTPLATHTHTLRLLHGLQVNSNLHGQE